jgi:hypothetical protein
MIASLALIEGRTRHPSLSSQLLAKARALPLVERNEMPILNHRNAATADQHKVQ